MSGCGVRGFDCEMAFLVVRGINGPPTTSQHNLPELSVARLNVCGTL